MNTKFFSKFYQYVLLVALALGLVNMTPAVSVAYAKSCGDNVSGNRRNDYLECLTEIYDQEGAQAWFEALGGEGTIEAVNIVDRRDGRVEGIQAKVKNGSLPWGTSAVTTNISSRVKDAGVKYNIPNSDATMYAGGISGINGTVSVWADLTNWPEVWAMVKGMRPDESTTETQGNGDDEDGGEDTEYNPTSMPDWDWGWLNWLWGAGPCLLLLVCGGLFLLIGLAVFFLVRRNNRQTTQVQTERTVAFQPVEQTPPAPATQQVTTTTTTEPAPATTGS